MTTKFLLLVKSLYYLALLISLLISWKIFALFILGQIFWRRSYKVREITTESQLSFRNGQLLAPVHGVVKEIFSDENRYVLKIKIELFSHKAIYAMGNAEIDSVESYEHSQKTFARRSLKKLMARPKYKAMQLSFLDGEMHYSLSIINTSLSLRPSTIVMPGDRVRVGAYLGWIPMGGIVLLEFPKTGKLLVKAHDQIKMFNTILMEKN